MRSFYKTYNQNVFLLTNELRADESYDVIVRKIKIANKNATLFCINGLIKDDVIEKNLQYLFKIKPEDLNDITKSEEFLKGFITYLSAEVQRDVDKFVTDVLTGDMGIVVEGFEDPFIVDCKNLPSRDVQEPESDKVLRGSHEGFVESIIVNTALLRKKIRSRDLIFERHKIGRESQTDVVLCYNDLCVNRKQLKIIQEKIKKINIKNLALGHETLRECLLPNQTWNPFPKIRYTERPDAAAACISDGNIIILTDGSPTAMIAPTGIFDFAQDINDFYFSPVIASMLRHLRVLVFTLSMIFIPLWYLIVIIYEEHLPDALAFMKIEEPYTVPVFVQLVIVEFVIDTLRLASLNTPSVLSNSFSVVGALVLGEFAVSSGWFVSEVVLFMSFVTISNFVQPSYELGYSIKICRLLLLIMTAFFKLWGFIIGLLLIIIVVATTKTISGYTYLYPLIPFDRIAFKNLIIRRNVTNKNK